MFDETLAVPQETGLGNIPRRMTRRQQLQYRRDRTASDLDAIDKALAALDAHPELEEFIETLAKAGS